MLIFNAKHRPASFLDQLQEDTSSASVKNIGVVFDSTLSLDTHVKVARLDFFRGIPPKFEP